MNGARDFENSYRFIARAQCYVLHAVMSDGRKCLQMLIHNVPYCATIRALPPSPSALVPSESRSLIPLFMQSPLWNDDSQGLAQKGWQSVGETVLYALIVSGRKRENPRVYVYPRSVSCKYGATQTNCQPPRG